MKSTSGLSACCHFNNFTNPRTIDLETAYFFAVLHERLHALLPHMETCHGILYTMP